MTGAPVIVLSLAEAKDTFHPERPGTSDDGWPLDVTKTMLTGVDSCVTGEVTVEVVARPSVLISPVLSMMIGESVPVVESVLDVVNTS